MRNKFLWGPLAGGSRCGIGYWTHPAKANTHSPLFYRPISFIFSLTWLTHSPLYAAGRKHFQMSAEMGVNAILIKREEFITLWCRLTCSVDTKDDPYTNICESNKTTGLNQSR